MREEVPFGEIPLGDFFVVVNVKKNKMWKDSTEEFQIEGKFQSSTYMQSQTQRENKLLGGKVSDSLL